ncbi:MarR family winged helix-turn-helix transcriptional regulator [Lutibaculum baratangense]|uniref:Transcriptional regulator, MarR family protein n=1 Tax=Lutibaculum baratangense AMV1 TaxID=631454 RepID=V4RC93_9HYPH|nr:MarR family transcriptional regulator [Lutibaculum baratangense]ESR22999.1 transcriptional regulator, MarR family protein [Lutibaculum baratangense AMV1]
MSGEPVNDGIGAEGGDIRDLFSYNLQRLAGVSTRIALLDIKPTFGLNMHDWRALAVLDYLGAAPLQVLAQRAGVQKSQMSRTTVALEQRGLIGRTGNPRDKRSSLLQLTDEGKRIAREVLKVSHERNRRMLAHLSQQEREQLMVLMEKVTRGSLEFLADLKGGSDPEELQTPEPRTLFETETF